MKDIRPYIRKLPINSSRKIELYNSIQSIFHRIKYSSSHYEKIKRDATFLPTNGYYGHEYWLKNYSGYSDYIYGLIEHGVYFGDNKTKVGHEEEWDLGSIITYGDSRINLLMQLYPDYYILGIGPRIHYVDIDMQYYHDLRSLIDTKSKVMVLYPHHSLYQKESEYDSKVFISDASRLAKELNVKNVLVSLHPADIVHGFQKTYESVNFISVTGGKNQQRFLPRLKAIMTLSDIIYSNTLGTHVGYGIYLNKPVVIDLRSNHNHYSLTKYEEEQKTFENVFNGFNPYLITKEQWELCDYYFGYSHIKTPDELLNGLCKCKEEFKKRYR